MKKLLLTLTVLLGTISAAFAQLDVLTAKGFWPNNQSYTETKESENTFLSVKWNAYGFSNNNSLWDNIRCGSTNKSLTDPYYPAISSSAAVSEIVGQFVVNTAYPQTAEANKITALKLIISDNENFTNPAEISFENCSEAGDWTIDIPAANQGANKFYKFEFTCPKPKSKNGYFAVNSITANAPAGAVKNVEINYEITGTEATVTITCATEGATIYYGFAQDAITNEYNAPFKLTESCTVYAYAKKNDEQSYVVNRAIDVPYSSFKSAIANAANKESITIVKDCEVLYQSANNTHLLLTDGTSNIYIYGSSTAYAVGTKFSTITGSVTIFNDKLFELTDVELTEGGNGASYTVNEVSALADITEDNLFDEILIKGCNITGKSSNNATLVLGSESIPLYNTFGINFENGTNYDVTCFVWKNSSKSGNGELQIAPVSIENGEFKETVKTPAITPSARELHEGDKVTITCATDGATIYYTTDGSVPTTSSTLYTAPFEINFGEDQERTVKAFAVKDDMLDSEVASKEYHFFDPTCNIITADNHEGSANSYTAHTCTIDGVDYAMNAIHNTTQGIQMNNNTTRFIYLIQTGDNEGLVVKNIEVDFSSNTNNITFTVLGSNKPFTNEKEGIEVKNELIANGVEIGTISNTNLSVEFKKDYNYFAFYPSKNGVVYINSITINYREPKAIAEAPVIPENFEENIESDGSGLIIPELPSHEDWTPMYQVNDGDPIEADPEGTIHEEDLDPATHHTITIWYEHYNGTNKSEAKVYHHVTAPKFESGVTGTSDDKVTNINFGTIGEGITVYFTLDNTTPTYSNTTQRVIARATVKDGVYDIASESDLTGTHAITSESTLVKIHPINATSSVSVKAIAVHAESNTASAVTTATAVDIPTGIENVAVEAEEAVYYNLQGVRVANPENGVYVRIQGGKAEKVMVK